MADPIVICDIDGTLIQGGRLVERVYAYADEAEGALFIVTGRPDSERADTEEELASLGVEYSELRMNDGSTADSTEFKKATAESLLQTYDVVLAIENNPDALRAYRSLGITAIDPADIPEQPADTDPESEDGGVPAEPMDENRFVKIAENLLEKLFKETRASKREIRTQEINFEIRALDETGMRFSGYAAVFNEPSQDLGGFVEYIQPGAFARTLQSRNRMMLLWNHDTSSPLASTRNGSLTLREDARGLFVEATLPDTTLGRDIATLVRSGTIDAMSFGFKVQKDSWNDGGNVRTLEDVSLFEISLVSYPAYESTSGTVAVRNYVAVADKTEIDVNVLADAMNNFEAGNNLSADQVDAISSVLTKLAPVVEEKPNAELLALKKKKFDLLVKDLHIN